MLLTTLLIQHPEAAFDIVRQTPPWVGALLAGLLVLGLSGVRARDVHIARLVLLPVAMIGLAVWGVQSAFAATGRLPELLALWAACGAGVLAVGARLAPPSGTHYDTVTRSFHLPGRWLPLVLILAVFSLKYGMGVQLALEPALARNATFAFAVTALYGLLSGLFAARALRVLRLAQPGVTVAAATV